MSVLFREYRKRVGGVLCHGPVRLVTPLRCVTGNDKVSTQQLAFLRSRILFPVGREVLTLAGYPRSFLIPEANRNY